MDIITTFGVRGKIEPKNGPQRNGFFGGLLKKRLLLSGDSKSLALLGYCYTIEGHHLILHCQNWWTLPLKLTLLVLGQYVGGKSSEIAGSYCPPPDFQKENKKKENGAAVLVFAVHIRTPPSLISELSPSVFYSNSCQNQISKYLRFAWILHLREFCLRFTDNRIYCPYILARS